MTELVKKVAMNHQVACMNETDLILGGDQEVCLSSVMYAIKYSDIMWKGFQQVYDMIKQYAPSREVRTDADEIERLKGVIRNFINSTPENYRHWKRDGCMKWTAFANFSNLTKPDNWKFIRTLEERNDVKLVKFEGSSANWIKPLFMEEVDK